MKLRARNLALLVAGLFPILTASSSQVEEIQVHRNLGKAYYEQTLFEPASRELTKVLESRGAEARDAFNAGMALLFNGEEDAALAALTTAKQMDPALISADFGLGVLHKRQLRYPMALDAFKRVVARDPGDPCTWFNIGAVSFSMERWEEAAQAFQRVLDMGFPVAQNFYVSALFRKATLSARQNRNEEAERLLSEFQRLRDQIPNVSLSATALENGKYGQIQVPPVVAERTADRPVPPAFARLGDVRFADSPCPGESAADPSAALGDYDGDRRLDIFVSHPCGPSRLFRNQGGGRFADVTADAGLGESRPSVSALFLDHENSGFASLVVLSRDGNRLYRNHHGKFTDVTERSGLASQTSGPGMSAIAFDLDNDGQVDIALNGMPGPSASAGLRVYRNNGDGTFQDVTESASLDPFTGSPTRGLGFADFDEDRFADLLVVREGPSAVFLKNLGNATFRATPISLGSGPAGHLAARVLVGDFNHDGWFDALVLDERGHGLLLNREGRLEASSALPAFVSHRERWALAFDADADGWSDFLLRDAEGRFRLLSWQGKIGLGEISIDFPASASGFPLVADLDGQGSTDIVAAGSDGVLRLFRRASPAPSSWLELALEGQKSNRQGVGAVVEVKAGLFYQKHLARGLPLTIYPSGRSEIDVVRVTWSNGVIQNELGVKANQRLDLVESELQTSSCPFLYVWDGEGFQFLTDVLGRAPLGEPLPSGGSLTPYPEDHVRIPPGRMREDGGRFVFQVTEELKEIAYLDSIVLLAVDHPAGTELFANERFSSPPFEPFKLHIVSERRAPVRAETEAGDEVCPRLAAADGWTVDGFARDRIPGLAEDHALILVPPEEVSAWKPLKLLLSGWVYWASSSSMKALSTRSGFSLHPPELQVKDEQGRWVTVIKDLGLPSGIDRTLVVDLTDKFLSADRSVRIATNLRVYWDQAFFARTAEPATAAVRTLRPSSSDLHFRGFSTPVGGERGAPQRFDYSRLLPQPPWNAPAGLYTRFGNVQPLLESTDDRLVVLAPGDELTIAFDGKALPPLAPGHARDFLLHVTGWAKDNDPHTAFFRSVEPLPYRAMTAYSRAAEGRPRSPDYEIYLRTYQTRHVPLLIAPLAPPASRGN